MQFDWLESLTQSIEVLDLLLVGSKRFLKAKKNPGASPGF